MYLRGTAGRASATAKVPTALLEIQRVRCATVGRLMVKNMSRSRNLVLVEADIRRIYHMVLLYV